MTWQNLSDRMLRTALSVFGETVMYTRGTTAVPISKAVFDKNYVTVDPNTGAQIMSTNPMIGVRVADLPNGEAREGDLVTVRGVEYRVIDKQPDSEGHIKLILQR